MQKYKQGFFIIHVVNFLKHKLVKVLIFGGKGLLGKGFPYFYQIIMKPSVHHHLLSIIQTLGMEPLLKK